ncbi:MAG: ferrous iron transport protein A [Clostridia bacterium]|nr:ferrous iron transport protein A [Clostridia bacterium]
MEKMRLCDVPVGKTIYIDKILAKKSEKLRLLDFGMVKNATITPVFVSPSGDPVAYEIKNSIIALRNSLASGIIVKEEEG